MLTVFGRVPFFYYVLHIPLIHLLFVCLSLARFGSVIPWMTANHPMFNPPPPSGYTYSLTALSAITLLAVTILYDPLLPLPLVRGREGAPARSLAGLPVV